MRRRGRPPHPDILTPREWEVVELIEQGLSNREIADRLGISLSGAKFHVSEILTKLGLRRRADVRAWRAGGTPSRLPAVAFLLGGPGRVVAQFGLPRVAALAVLGAGAAAFALFALFVLTSPRNPDAVTVVNQGFSLVGGTHLTYAFLAENSDASLALDGAKYRVRFLDSAGTFLEERSGDMPLVLPSQTVAVAEEALQGLTEAASMTVTIEGGRLLPAEDLPGFHPIPMDGYSGGGTIPLTQLATTLYNPFPDSLQGVLVTPVFFASDGRILGGHTEVRAALPPGNTRTEMWLKYGPSEPDMSPRVTFYVAPAAGSLGELQAIQRADARATPEPGRPVRWQPAQAPLFHGPEASQPFEEEYGDITSYIYRAEGDGPASLVHETSRWIRWLDWQDDGTALHVSVVTSAEGVSGPEATYLQGILTLSMPSAQTTRTLISGTDPLFPDRTSPSGDRVAYQPSEHEVYVIEPDGSARRLEGLGETLEFVSWSPRGDAMLVFVYEPVAHRIQVDGRLYVVPVEGGVARPVDPPMEGLQGRYAAWSPGGTRIAFLADGEPRTYEYGARGDLFVFDLRSGQARRLLVHDDEYMPDPVWTADGRYLLLAGDLVDASTGDLTRLTANASDAIGGSLSPDGRYYVVTEQPSPGVCPGDELANRTLMRDLVTGDQRVLLDCDDGFYFTFASASTLAWTNDGRSIVLLSSSRWGTHGHVWKVSLLDVETGELKTLAERPVEGRLSVFVSPDGERIATTGDAVRVFDGAGTLLATHDVPDGYEVRVAAWSPDGSTLAFAAVPAHAFLGP